MDRKNKIRDSEKDKSARINGDGADTSTVKDEGANSERRQEERRQSERRQILRRTIDVQNTMDGESENQLIKDLKMVIQSKDNDLEKLKKEIETFKDLIQRRQADFENYKKRMIKFQEEQKKFAIKDIALDIINIDDDLLRALEASSNIDINGSLEDNHKSFVKGVSMISGRIEETLKKYGVVELEAINQAFDPNFHEAVEIEKSTDFNVDTVTKVYQKGFRIDDIIIRSARVRVAKSMKQAAIEKNGSGPEEKTENG